MKKIPTSAVETNTVLPKVFLGARSSCVLSGPRDLKCWGLILNNVNLLEPTSMTTLTDIYPIKELATGTTHSCLLTTQGNVKCWNYNLTLPPEDVSGVESGVSKISGFYDHFCALLSSGRLKCWKYDSQNSAVVSDVKVNAVTVISDVKDVVVGNHTSCAILNDGKLMCWGYLGDSVNAEFATEIPLSNVTSVSVGGKGFCALLASGEVKCMGEYPGLGGDENDPNTVWDSGTSITPVGLDSGVVAISSGYNFRCALLSSGVVKCWGYVGTGELGNNIMDWHGQMGPGQVANLSEAINLTSSSNHSCVVIDKTTLKCWGDNSHGQIGNNSTSDGVPSPFEIKF